MPASVTMEIGVNLRVGNLPGDLTDVEEREKGDLSKLTGRLPFSAVWIY